MHAFVDRPKIVLHDHLDGGVRPATVIDLADQVGVEVPCRDLTALMDWFTIRPDMNLEDAFGRFDLVISMMQSEAALRRVAREAVEDLHADGVIHAELRFAPLAHTADGLTGDDVIAAVTAGIGEADAPNTTATVIVCSLRNYDPSTSSDAARLAAAWADRGVVGFDLAGPEMNSPAAAHAEAFALARDAGLGLTVHAGEMDGVGSLSEAIAALAPDRIGHGWRIIDDCEVRDGRISSLGPTAAEMRDKGTALEICLTSNACLGQPVDTHPAGLLAEAGFRVTLNPDDRSITTTSTSREHDLAARVLGFTSLDLAVTNERAAVAAFVDDDRRAELVATVREGWRPRTPRLVHLAERSSWESGRGSDRYLPEAFSADGFIHLSALYQVLTPANNYYRGRDDLVAVVLDTRELGDALVWENGTGTAEFFPHLYGAIARDAVVDEVEFLPGRDGSFLLPRALVHAMA